jgi:DNA repair protein RadA/Sms
VKSTTVFVCADCGRQLPKWAGRCPGCGAWNTIVEKEAPSRRVSAPASEGALSGNIVSLADIPAESAPRLRTAIGELDRVLGGGLVKRSVILVGGDPGIGKSTLLMQALDSMARAGSAVLYVSGEESSEQLKLRAERLGIRPELFYVLVENELEVILDRMDESDAAVVVVDSVQSVSSRAVQSHPGSVSQVREVADRIVGRVKKGSSACFLVGHVTKDGMLAGPRVLEHMVDTVLYFEGERGHPYRILRAVKNRFGSASEIGVFEMSDAGLREVSNPSEIFISERPEETSGSTVTALVEGSRPILAEIQALVSGPVPGQGRRTCLGVDAQRLALMVAVIEKKLGLVLGDHDIFLNAVGGIKAIEPAADLAVAAALLSSFLDRAVPSGTLVFGEVGLAGEVRRVSRAAERMNEAARLGFVRIVAPGSNCDPASCPESVEATGISHVSELLRSLFP